MSRTHHLPNVAFHGTCDAEASHYAQTTSEVTGFDPISIYTINFNFSMIYDRSRESDILPKKGCFNLKFNLNLRILKFKLNLEPLTLKFKLEQPSFLCSCWPPFVSL